MRDEISGASGRPAGRSRAALIALVAAAVVVAGVVSLRRGVEPVRVRPPASPPAAQMPSLPGELGPSPGPLGLPAGPVPALSLGEVCQPVHTDGRTRLDVSFTLVNTVDRPVTLVRVVPELPLGGLRELRTEVRSGTCAAPGPPVRTGVIPGRGAVLAVFQLGLPPTCPAPLPVQATVAERRGARPVVATVLLLADLGGLHFATC